MSEPSEASAPPAKAVPATGTQRILDCAFDLLQEGAETPGRLADVPCGTGYLSVKAAQAGWSVRAFDIAPELFQGSGQGLEAEAIDLNQPLTLDDDAFDGLVCCEGIEHIENPWLVLREFHRIVRPGGQVVISLPNTIDLRQRWRLLRRGFYGHYPPFVPDHINSMGPFMLCTALLRTGFEIVDVRAPKTYGGLFMQRLVAPWFGLSRDCGLPEPVRKLLSSRDVLCGRTVVVSTRVGAAG